MQIAARHADPKTTMRYDRARKTSTGTQLHPRRVHGLRHLNTLRLRVPCGRQQSADVPCRPLVAAIVQSYKQRDLPKCWDGSLTCQFVESRVADRYA